jgi:hypothetical protein
MERQSHRVRNIAMAWLLLDRTRVVGELEAAGTAQPVGVGLDNEILKTEAA